ncbi:MAG: ADP-ribosylglycohydrolase family protein [Clostridia bacterium]|nr:ADP-ribosylglycohydrolase family protein [Clostridia bacterium]
MLGAIIGDVVGSLYEFSSDKTKSFELLTPSCHVTDDSIMTIAVGCACVSSSIYDREEFQYTLCRYMRELGNMYPDAGYGQGFYNWLMDEDAEAYGSYGNGSAMRVSPVAWVAESLEDAERLARWSAEVTHNHEYGIKGAQAVSACIYMARQGQSKESIREYIRKKYYPLDFTLDEIRPKYSFDVTCEGSVPQAIMCFLESDGFEDAIRNAISLGGDGDTIGAIAGSIAEAYYGIPEELQEKIFDYIDEDLIDYYNTYADEIY